jgi:hypothetical protein
MFLDPGRATAHDPRVLGESHAIAASTPAASR